MASSYFLVLVAIALLPFALARQNPSDVAHKDGLVDPTNLHSKPPITLPKLCLFLPANTEGTGKYQPSGLVHLFRCPPPPPGTTSPPPSSPPVPTPAPTPSGPAPTPTSPVRAPSPAPTAP